ncbi:hypothetical protein Q4E93_23560 [Flavitalea sp. BT771]|uniref:hypothetical protein n=1 Tax=Flavitalea sp. BT771 TaxID=3063329 RepID=UPI0026E25BC6|nr:hypothetical protein [Flavitalea sp. BT771]MDO6433609.1 hypothetical protein [Flavitalea sp. BT771]MDV6222486.1 hypothetical protein [Flavitalea sp. BT771]
MRPFLFISACLVILLTTSCGKSSLHSPVVGNWKQVFYPYGAPVIPTPPTIQSSFLTLRSDRTFESRIGNTVIQDGTYHVGHTSNPSQDILYLSDDPYGFRISFSKDTLKLAYLGITTGFFLDRIYVRN